MVLPKETGWIFWSRIKYQLGVEIYFFHQSTVPLTLFKMLKFVPAEGHLKRKAYMMIDKVKSMHITESTFPFSTTVIF